MAAADGSDVRSALEIADEPFRNRHAERADDQGLQRAPHFADGAARRGRTRIDHAAERRRDPERPLRAGIDRARWIEQAPSSS